jgi:hypothetical protein
MQLFAFNSIVHLGKFVFLVLGVPSCMHLLGINNPLGYNECIKIIILLLDGKGYAP